MSSSSKSNSSSSRSSTAEVELDNRNVDDEKRVVVVDVSNEGSKEEDKDDIIDDVWGIAEVQYWKNLIFDAYHTTKKKLLSHSPLELLQKNWGVLILMIVYSIILIVCHEIEGWDFEWQGWFLLVLLMCVIVVLVKDVVTPGVVFIFATGLLVCLRIIDTKMALSGFGNEGVATVAILFPVSKAIQLTGALDAPLKKLLGSPKSVFWAQARLMTISGLVSAVTNNTPQVAVMIPVVETWCSRIKINPSKLMIPLSYSSILGGTLATIGTSTNLIVIGLAQDKDPTFHVGLFEIGKIGAPVCVFGILYILAVSRWLLPDRPSMKDQYRKNPREYSVAVKVAYKSRIHGKTIEDAGLRGLSGLFLVEVQRNNELFSAPASDFKLEGGDVLIFAGVTTSIKDLWEIKGIEPVTDQVEKITASDRKLFEVVVANHSTLIGKTVRESKFRTNYNAAVIAVHRYGERIRSKIGDIVLAPGDCMLVEADRNFVRDHGEDHSFALVSMVNDYTPPVRDYPRLIFVICIVSVMIILSTVEQVPNIPYIDIFTAALLTSFILVAVGCISLNEAIRSIEFEIILAMAAAFGIGKALETTGVATALADTVTDIFRPIGDVGLLFGIYVATMFLTALTSNSATVVIMYPICYRFFERGIFTHKTIAFILMMAASADFSTPIGYQTNLMVSGPGGYKFTDYLKIGPPLQIVCCISSVLICYALFE